jgi:hypothetical protein
MGKTEKRGVELKVLVSHEEGDRFADSLVDYAESHGLLVGGGISPLAGTASWHGEYVVELGNPSLAQPRRAELIQWLQSNPAVIEHTVGNVIPL